MLTANHISTWCHYW